MQSAIRQPRIPEQQPVGQTLPPVPVGIDTSNSPPLPPGAMPNGTRVQVQKYLVIIHNFVAEGGFAHVYLARIEGKQGFVILKRVAVPDTERLKTVEKEIAFMKKLGDHKNITRYYASRIDPLPTGGFEAFILMEYCPGGGVIDLMNRRLQQRLTEPEILKIFSDVCEALAYMHYCTPPVLHRDLKVENILILGQDHYKLCDFGSAALSKGDYVPTTLQEIQKIEDDIQRHTTLQYRAPEMIDVYQKRPINEKADIWALGVLLYKLCYYTTPFEEQGQLAILNARYSIPSHPPFSDGVRRLIVSLLQEDQRKRPNIYQVLKAVCQLRGVPCPIRNIYADTQSPPESARQSPKSDQATSSPGAIFERMPTPPQQMLEIIPMRRGRPTRHVKSSSGTQIEPEKTAPAATAAASFDPFDPAHVNASSKSEKLDFDPNSIFSLNEKSLADANFQAARSDQEKVEARKSLLAFESDFDPSKFTNNNNSSSQRSSFTPRYESPPMVSAVPSGQNSSSVTGSDHSDDNTAKDKEDDDRPKIRNLVASDIESRIQSLQMHATAATATTTAADADIIGPPKPSRSTPSSQQQQKYKPTPPPKPARFRLSNVVAPVLEPTSSSTTSNIIPNNNKDDRRPSLTDFEEKFPPIDDLYKKLPVDLQSK